jgi:hypothetical protein
MLQKAKHKICRQEQANVCGSGRVDEAGALAERIGKVENNTLDLFPVSPPSR